MKGLQVETDEAKAKDLAAPSSPRRRRRSSVRALRTGPPTPSAALSPKAAAKHTRQWYIHNDKDIKKLSTDRDKLRSRLQLWRRPIATLVFVAPRWRGRLSASLGG